MARYNCERCGKELSALTTGLFPFGKGYVCNVCYDELGEEFCRAVDELPPSDSDDVDPMVFLLHLL